MKFFKQNSLTVVLWKLLFLSWIYFGFIRNLIPSISTFIYFLPNIIILAIFLGYRPEKLLWRHIFSWIILLTSVFLIFYKFVSGSTSLESLIQGLNLYIFGMLLFVSTDGSNVSIKNLDLSKIIEISIIPNLFLAILQVPLKVPYFQTSELSNRQHLLSADGYIRAYGTFTSTTGFTLYLAVVISYSLSNISRFTQKKFIAVQLSTLSMVLMSQSRTALVFTLFQYLSYKMVSKRTASLDKKDKRNSSSSRLKIGRWFIFSSLFFPLVLPDTLKAFSNRISLASQSENSIHRLLSQQSSWINSLDNSLFGDGLASHTIGVVGYSNMSQQWIENDLERVMQESGLLLGLLILVFRFYWACSLFMSVTTMIDRKDFFMLLLTPSLIFALLQGPLYGQNDTKVFGWFFLTIFATRYFDKPNI